jgi:hypothetical protein
MATPTTTTDDIAAYVLLARAWIAEAEQQRRAIDERLSAVRLLLSRAHADGTDVPYDIENLLEQLGNSDFGHTLHLLALHLVKFQRTVGEAS